MVDESRLHPSLNDLLRSDGWTGLTVAQEAVLPMLLAGQHTLLVAPTGHGKTEAALLPVLSRLLAERDHLAAKGVPWPKGFKALYITPLRALNRDLLGRLTHWADALGLRIGVRHGDTRPAERARQSRDPPDLLITTPETVQLLLYGDTLRRHLRTVRFVILDEIHDLAASERGAQLSIALERIEEAIAQPATLAARPAKDRPAPSKTSARGRGSFHRIGLSATVADPAAVARFLGGRDRDVEIVRPAADKQIRLRVVVPAPTAGDQTLAGELGLPPDAVAQLRTVRELVAAHERVLVFHNTRDGAELLASRSAAWDEREGQPMRLGLHHGSLSAEHRADVEDRFKRGELKALVATSSLELGIDVGAIDHVVQVHSPRSVARLVQRLGRAGHRVGAVSEGTLVAGGPEDALECLAIAAAARSGHLEPVRARAAPLVVLANQLIALLNEYQDLGRDWAWHVVTRAGPFVELDEGLFDAVWDALADLRTLYPADDAPGHFRRSGRARRQFLDHIGLIPDERTYRVMDEATKRAIGSVDDAFVAAGLHPGASFIMAGRSWTVLEVEPEAQRVRVAPSKDLGAAPQWSGSQLPVSNMVAQEVGRLRGVLSRGEHPMSGNGGNDGDEGDVKDDCHDANDAITAAAAPILQQVRDGLVVPTDIVVTLERGRNRLVANVALGTRGNEALGRITQALLHQRLGTAVGMQSDAYRIEMTVSDAVRGSDIEDLWRSLDVDTLDLLLAMLLRDSPLIRHHLVHVAKHFGGLPKDLDPNRTTRKKLDDLLSHFALQEETLDRLVHDRFDLEAVAGFLRDVQVGRVRFVVQGMGPLSRLGGEEGRRMLAGPPTDETLLAAVRQRIEQSDVMLVCSNCRHHWQVRVDLLPRRIHCRRCSSNQVACLRPWNEDQVRLLGDRSKLDADERRERDRIIRNAQLVAAFGDVACRALVGRGVGPDTAGRILQKSADPEAPVFWREILGAELEFARTNAFWGR